MTYIGVRKKSFLAENRSWLLSQAGVGPGENPSIILDIASFDAEDHYPEGYIPSGIVLGKITASGEYGPYDATATDGRETAVELLFGSLTVEPGATVVGGAGVHRGEVEPGRLPIKSGTGALDAAARQALFLIRFADATTTIPTEPAGA